MASDAFDIDPRIERASTPPSRIYHDPEPYALQKERVFARTWQYALDANRLKAPGHMIEVEDEEVIESAQRGVRSRLCDRGRYSPRREVGTHHFHTLPAELMG